MWQMRLFGKKDYDNIDVDDTRNQWTPLFEVSGNEVYDDVDTYTVKCKVKFRTNDNVLLAYADNVMIFGYVTRARTIVADAQYEFEVTEYLNMLNKYPVPRFGTSTYNQIANKSTSMRSRIDNFSYPGGKKTLNEIMNIAMTGAGDKWKHEVDDFYYDGNSDKDILGPYFRWEAKTNPTSGYDFDRWYNIPDFTQAPGSYGQLPSPPNYDMKIGGRELVKVLSTADSDFWDQVYSIPWMPDEHDTTPEASLLEFKKKLVRYFPTVELCASTVFSLIKRMIIDLCKMNVWCEAKYNNGDFLFDPADDESISKVTFTVKYGYVRSHKVENTLQYIQYRSDDKAEDTDVECVLVFGYDHTTDVGMAVKTGASIPYKTVMWEYTDGRNEGELDALAFQILTDYKNSKLMIELDLKPGPAMYEDEIIHVGDMIRVQNNDIIDYHLSNGWSDTATTSRYAKRMKTLVDWNYMSAERNDAIFTVKAIRYSISKTILELSEARTDIFEIMGDKLKRIEGTTQGYDIDEVLWKKADLTLCGRPDGEYPYTNTDPSSSDYGTAKLISSLPSLAPGTPTNFLTWDGLKWINATEYIGDNYPAWTQLLIMVKEEDHMAEIPDSRGMVPLNYIGPWFNIEVKLIGSIPSMTHNSSGALDYNNPSVGNGWVIPYVYDSVPATSIWSTPTDLAKLELDGKYELPDAKCRLPESWRTGIYFESETDCMIAPELLAIKTAGAAGVGCMNYAKIGPIPKGFDSVVVTSNITFFDQVMAELSGDSGSNLASTITSRGRTGLNCFTFNFQWCLGRDARPRSTAYNESTKQCRQGYWDAGTLVPSVWDEDPDCVFDGQWNNTMLTPTWSTGYASRTATLHTAFSLANKRLSAPVEDASLYLRYVVFFDSYRSNSTFMYNFVALAGWSVSVTCTPGYELLVEWYKTRTHKIQMMVDGKGSWDKGGGSMTTGPISLIIDWPDEDHMNDEGYFCFDIKKFLGLDANYVRLRSVKEISPGIYSPAEVDIRARYISGWLKD